MLTLLAALICLACPLLVLDASYGQRCAWCPALPDGVPMPSHEVVSLPDTRIAVCDAYRAIHAMRAAEVATVHEASRFVASLTLAVESVAAEAGAQLADSVAWPMPRPVSVAMLASLRAVPPSPRAVPVAYALQSAHSARAFAARLAA